MRSLVDILRYLKPRRDGGRCPTRETDDGWAEIRSGERQWERYYRRRWQYDKKVRSTHGVNCTGSCSWTLTFIGLLKFLIRSLLPENRS